MIRSVNKKFMGGEKIKQEKLRPHKDNLSAILDMQKSLPKEPGITSDSSPEDVIRRLEERGEHELAEALRRADMHRRLKKGPTEQGNLDL